VKTKLKRADSHGTNTHLPVWKASSTSNVVDATTGASLTSYTTPLTVTWNATNVSGAVVPDGTYNVRVEFTWQHGTTATSNTTFSFTKGPSAVHLTPANQTEYTGIVLDWVPSVAAPVASFIADNSTICQNGNITFTDQSTNTPTSWLWNFGDGQTSTLQNPSHQYATAGTYTVALTATNAGGNNTSTQTNLITVNPIVVPAVSIAALPATSVCPGTTVVMTATPTNGGTPTYSWTVDGSVVGTGNSYSAAFTDGQAVVCTMTSNANCANPTTATSSTFTSAVYTVNPVVVTETAGSFNSDATSGNQWYEQSTGIIAGETNATFTPTVSGNYYTIVTDANGCTSTSNIMSFTSGIENNNLDQSIKVYPNLSTGIVTIESNNIINAVIEVINVTGEKVMVSNINGTSKTLDLSKLSNGVYFVKVADIKYQIALQK
jgi:PKD repeat protein